MFGSFTNYDRLEFEPEIAHEDRTKHLLKLRHFVRGNGLICSLGNLLIYYSASACAAIKTSKLPELTARADLTCKSRKAVTESTK